MPPTMPPYAPDPHDLVDTRRRVTTPWLTFFNALVGQINSLIILVAGGITQLTGPVTTGVGGGVQATTITPTGVTPGTYGNATNVGQFTVNTAGQLTFAANVAISASGTTPASPHYEPVTNGDPVNPDLIYNSGGDLVMGWVT